MASGAVPNVLSIRTRTASPGMVRRASMRTVALVTAAVPSACCEVPHAVIHRAAAGGCWSVAMGDPEKAGPCGGSNTDWGKPSYVISKAVGGSKLHIKVQETIYHPGHYRVSLALNSPTELPVDPEVATKESDRGPQSVSATIQNP